MRGRINPELRAEVTRLHAEGLRSTAIAARLGITRSAASGYVSRLGLVDRRPMPEAWSFPRGCLWIEGDVVRGEPPRFCGARVDPGEPNPWCPEHRRRVYVKSTEASD